MKRNLYILLGLIMIASMLLASCGQAAPKPINQNRRQKRKAADSSESAEAVEPVTIRVMTFFAHDNPEVEEAVVAAFEETHPNINIQLEQTAMMISSPNTVQISLPAHRRYHFNEF